MTRHTHHYGYALLGRGGGGRIVQEPRAVRRTISRQGFARRFRCSRSGGRAARGAKQAQLCAAIERERNAAAERKAERERNADMAFYIERALRDRGVRTISREDIFKIMPEVRAAASKIHYGSQTEIMAKIVQEKLAPKQSRGMRR